LYFTHGFSRREFFIAAGRLERPRHVLRVHRLVRRNLEIVVYHISFLRLVLYLLRLQE
jgi:hypothetical protein